MGSLFWTHLILKLHHQGLKFKRLSHKIGLCERDERERHRRFADLGSSLRAAAVRRCCVYAEAYRRRCPAVVLKHTHQQPMRNRMKSLVNNTQSQGSWEII
ncbi:hypothetical protein SLA2020_367060 [Shorea laevis]